MFVKLYTLFCIIFTRLFRIVLLLQCEKTLSEIFFFSKQQTDPKVWTVQEDSVSINYKIIECDSFLHHLLFTEFWITIS